MLYQGVTKRYRLSWLTNSSANEYRCAHGAQINFGDLTPYLTYACTYALMYVSHRFIY
jgi:hypothetical protein